MVDNEDSAFRVQEKKSFRLQDFFNKGEKVYKGIFMFPDERVWKKAVEVEDNFGGKLFGTPVSTAMYKLVGDGSLSASWKAHIREAGEYEVFVYVYHMGVRGNRKEMARTKGEKNALTHRQYYTVRSGGEEYHVSTETYDKWEVLSGGRAVVFFG